MEKQETVHKVTLGTGKIIYLREMDNRKEELAFQAGANKAAGNEMMVAYHAQNEILKLLVAGIQDKGAEEVFKPKAADIEMLDKYISYAEQKQLKKVVSKMMGEDLGSEPVIETSFSGTL